MDTSSKAKKGKTPKLGLKRKRSPSESDASEIEVSKRKLLGNGKTEEVKMKRKQRPKEFKLGKWNPDVELVKEDREKESNDPHMFVGCCIRCNNRNVIRAAITDNKALMSEAIMNINKVSQVTDFWSSDCVKTALDYIIENDKVGMLEVYLKPKVKPDSKHRGA